MALAYGKHRFNLSQRLLNVFLCRSPCIGRPSSLQRRQHPPLTEQLAAGAVHFEGVVAGVDVAAEVGVEGVSVLALHGLGLAAVTAPEVVAVIGVDVVTVRLGTHEQRLILGCKNRHSVTQGQIQTDRNGSGGVGDTNMDACASQMFEAREQLKNMSSRPDTSHKIQTMERDSRHQMKNLSA